MPEYVQAWVCSGPWSGIVYDQMIALDKLSQGCDIQSVTIVRHEDGTREHLPGTVAAEVRHHREGR
jgi:hypothetical protein